MLFGSGALVGGAAGMLASAHDHALALIPSILPLPALWLLGGAAAGEWGDARQ